MAKSVDMEGLLRWAYKDQLVDLIERGAGLANDVARLDARAASLVHVDSSGVSAQEAHPDAVAVHAAVRGLWPEHRDLAREAYPMILHYARVGGWPDWLPGAKPKLRGVFRANGKAKIEYSADRKTPLYCPIEYVLTPANILYARAQYSLWWESVDAARVAVQRPGVLRDHEVTGFRAPFEPWSAEERGRAGLGAGVQQAA